MFPDELAKPAAAEVEAEPEPEPEPEPESEAEAEAKVEPEVEVETAALPEPEPEVEPELEPVKPSASKVFASYDIGMMGALAAYGAATGEPVKGSEVIGWRRLTAAIHTGNYFLLAAVDHLITFSKKPRHGSQLQSVC